MKENLKIGFVVADIHNVPAWYYQTIKEVEQKGYDIFFLVLDYKHKRRKPALLYSLFEKFENKWFRSDYDAAEPRSVEGLMSDNVIRFSNQNSTLNQLEWNELRGFRLDVIYTINANLPEADLISEAADYGLWAIRFGYSNYLSNRLPAFWEVMQDNPVTGSSLVIYKDKKALIAYEGTTRTVPYSVKNNFNSIAWKSSSYLLLRLYTLEVKRDLFFNEITEIKFPASLPGKNPGNSKMLFLFLRNGMSYLKDKLRSKFTKDTFTILYSLTTFSLDALTTTKFIPVQLRSTDVFYADPFVVEKDGINYIFFEEMVYSKGKAHISVSTIGQNKKLSSPQVVLDKPYHLSYPFVFEHEGVYYMIPETSSNRTVELYKAARFPDKWEFVMNLMEDVLLIDVTLIFDKGKWWLFGNSSNHPFVSTNDQLFLFYSNHLFSSNWKAHPQNPIATHAENCRPAGRIFKSKGKLFRPAQNNASQQYGYGLKINEIEVLNENSYKEKEISSVTPDTFGLKACHHIDFSSSLVVIDGVIR